MMNPLRQYVLSLALIPLSFALFACSDSADKATGKTKTAASSSARLSSQQTAASVPLDVYKSLTCGCCGEWVEHAAQRGFTPTTHHPDNLNKLKADKGIGPEVQSCHTAVSVEGFVFEGHIPARYIRDFLANPPVGAFGLAVPAMPVGSPGMEVENRFMPYEVLLLKDNGATAVYAQVTTPAQQYQ